MHWYLIFLEFLVAGFIAVFARHTYLRGLYFLHIFQQKGYKTHEYWHWMVENWAQRVVTGKHVILLVIIAALLWFLSGLLTGSASIIILSIFAFFWFGPANFYNKQRPKKPLVFTPRVVRLSIPFFICCIILPGFGTWWAFMHTYSYILSSFPLLSVDMYLLTFAWLVGNAVIPFWLFIAAAITRPVEKRIHQHFIDQAKSKLAQMPELTIIAITGSYGKTSTKFMIRDLLSERMSVCTTPGSYNTPMGLCKVINNDLHAHHRVLILEMGARYEGNIAELCDIARPDISVVTNVGIAHLETFGSQDAIARTKSTIISRLSKNGTAILNADDERVAAMRNVRDDITVIGAGLENGAVRGSDIEYNQEGVYFRVKFGDETEEFRMKLLGAHNVQNMLLAIAAASCFGVRLKTMAIAAREIEPIEHRLELKKVGDLTVIDDAFNSNPVGAKNAVEILAQFTSGRRVIITPGMIELGKLQEEKNREFGRQIGRADLDLVILVGASQTQAIQEGLRQAEMPEDRIKVVPSLFKANEIMQGFARPGDVVLYENDLPDSFNESL